MTNVILFDQRKVLNKDFRMYGTPESPLFLAKDVAEWIDYAKTGKGAYDVSRMLSSIDDDEKLIRTIFVSGQNRELWFLTEDVLYEVLMQSRKPIAKSFKKEVKTILKTIRQTGGFVSSEREDEFIKNYFPSFADDTKLTMVMDLKHQNEAYRQQISEQKPLVEFANQVTESEDTISLGEMAKIANNQDLPIGGRNKFCAWLRSVGVLDQHNVAYQMYIDKGYFQVIDAVKPMPYGSNVFPTTRVTGKGQTFIIKKLRKEFCA